MKDGTTFMDAENGLMWLEIRQTIKYMQYIKWEKDHLQNKYE